MSRSDRLKEKSGKSNRFSVVTYDDESAARTRPFSLEEIMIRRKNKEFTEKVNDPAKETWNLSPRGSSENIVDHVESARVYKHDKSSSPGMEKHTSEELLKVISRKKVSTKKDKLAERKNRGNYYSEIEISDGLNNIGRVAKKSKTDKEMHGWRKNDGSLIDNSDYEDENKCSRDLASKDKYADIDRQKLERKRYDSYRNGDDENPGKFNTERKNDKDRYDRGKRRKWSSDDSEKIAEKKHRVDSVGKDRHADSRGHHHHADSRGHHQREIKRKYRNGDEDKTQDRNAARKQDQGKHRGMGSYERKERQDTVKSHHEESRAKRRWTRSREREDRRRSPALSLRPQERTYHDGERKELSMHSLKDSSRKQHSDVERSRVSTNGSGGQHHRHGRSTSGLGGYSPRKRKTEAAVKTPSPSKHSLEKKRAGWDLSPIGTQNSSSALVSSSFQLLNQTAPSNIPDVDAATFVDTAIVKPLPFPFLNDSSTGKNSNTDSVQLTQATRPMRRLYLENLPASASEKALMDCLNNLLLSAGVNHIQGAQPCISCILHKDKGQALVEFLTAEDASAALSFDGSTLFGSIVKIRRPKDYVEVSTGDIEKSVDAAVTISDIVIDSPDKIFIGGISKDLSSEMLKEIAGAFGSLKAYHFETDETNGPCAFLEYVDHSVTLKACAGLNGMKLAREVLTVVQAMPNALSLENGDKPPSYVIPEHAKPLLEKPTQVLKIKDVFTVEALASLSDMAMEEVLEDVRFECARFGTIKSINVVKVSSDRSEASKSEVINGVEPKGAFHDLEYDRNNAESSFSEKATYPEFRGTGGAELHDGTKQLEEDKLDDKGGVDVDKLADEIFYDKLSQGEQQLVSDIKVDDVNTNIIAGVECFDHQDTNTLKDQSELNGKIVADGTGLDIENQMVAGDTDSKDAISNFKEGFSELDANLGTESIGVKKCVDDKDDICDHVFEPGSVLVEYGRIEACCLAAHCLHGRFFDGRMVTVEYVALDAYRARFKK